MTAAAVLAGDARWCVVEGDAAEVLATLPAASVHAVVTDPPSGIAFMGAEWDRDKGGRAAWCAWLAGILAHARAATVPGGRAFVWSLPRTSHWTGCAVEDAGWSIETTVQHLFGTGWPKGKSQLKPAAETWWLARTGPSLPLNVEACRVATTGERLGGGAEKRDLNNGTGWDRPWQNDEAASEAAAQRTREAVEHASRAGRYPPNAVFSHGPGCVREGERRVRGITGGTKAIAADRARVYGEHTEHPFFNHADPDGTEAVEAWRCEPGCVVAALDAQTSEETSESIGSQCVLPVESSAWQTKNNAHGEPSAADAGTGCGESRGADESSSNSNTDGCGSRPTGQSLRGSTSTTSTTTEQTTASKTSKRSKARSTGVTTRASGKITASSTGLNSAPVSGATSTSHSLSSAPAPRGPDTDTAGSAFASTFANGSGRTQPQRSGAGSTTRPSRSPLASQQGPSASVSRFFPQFEADDPAEVFRYIAKPSRAEKNAGCEDLAQSDGASVAPVASGKVMRCAECRRTHPVAYHGACVRCGGAVALDDAANDGSGRDGCATKANAHPTVKPLALMRWLIRLVTRPGDIVLDPFGGSGTTGAAALLEGRRVILVERDPRYAEIARARLQHAAPTRDRLATMATAPVRVEAPDFGPLFGGAR